MGRRHKQQFVTPDLLIEQLNCTRSATLFNLPYQRAGHVVIISRVWLFVNCWKNKKRGSNARGYRNLRFTLCVDKLATARAATPDCYVSCNQLYNRLAVLACAKVFFSTYICNTIHVPQEVQTPGVSLLFDILPLE